MISALQIYCVLCYHERQDLESKQEPFCCEVIVGAGLNPFLCIKFQSEPITAASLPTGCLKVDKHPCSLERIDRFKT